MNVRVLLTLAFAFQLTGALSAQSQILVGTPADVGVSANILRQGVALFEKAVADSDLQGAVLLVARRGKIVLFEPVGWRDREKQLPMTRDTLFHVASNTKPVIAAAVLMLAEEGKLDLNAAVLSYVPAFETPKANAITVQHLLTHTSGMRIPTIFIEPLLKKSEQHPDWPNLRAEVDRFGAVGAEVPPGTSYAYSNPGYNTLAALVEVVAGRPLEPFLAERIYRPLGMNDSSHRDRPEQSARRANIYRKKNGTWQVELKPGDPPQFPFARGSGGLVTTAGDYAKFLQMYLNRGEYAGRRLLKAETVRAATTPQTRSSYSAEQLKTQTDFYGYGWRVAADGTFSHAGSDGTYAWVDPTNDLIGLVFTQSTGGRNPRDEFVRLVSIAVERGADARALPGFDTARAAQYLDERAKTWFAFNSADRGSGETKTSCVCCHTIVPFALARSALRRVAGTSAPTEFEDKLIAQTRLRVKNWTDLDTPPLRLLYDFNEQKKKESWGTESVLNALILAFDDRYRGQEAPSAATRQAFANLWQTQIQQGDRAGSWDWLDFKYEPWESSGARYYGAALAAIAVGTAPGYWKPGADPVADTAIELLCAYLKLGFAKQNDYNRALALWASTKTPGVLSADDRTAVIHELFAKQRDDGGWNLASLGQYKRVDNTAQETASDGYATGLIVHILRTAGVPTDDAKLARGLTWLRTNQTESGAWRGVSLNKKRDPTTHVGKFMSDAATGYAVLALVR